MEQELFPFLTRLREEQRSKIAAYNEDQAKQGIILPLLRRLGWDIEDPDEVRPEYSLEQRRVDYALATDRRVAVFIEVKRPSEDLDNANHELDIGKKVMIRQPGRRSDPSPC